MSLITQMDESPIARLVVGPANPDAAREPLDANARRALPLVWMVLGAVAIALAVGWILLQIAPPPDRASRLLTVPGQPAPAGARLTGPHASPVPLARSPYARPGGAVRDT